MTAWLEGRRLLLDVALLTWGAVAAAIVAAGGYRAALPLLMIPTADIGFILFLLAFSASSLRRLWPGPATHYLMRNRRYIGLSFALVHFTHLVLVLSNITLVEGQERAAATLVPGAIAYLFLALMAATSNNASVRKLGPRRWKRLHKAGSYYIWFIFLATTLPPSAGSAWMLLLCLAVLGLRVAAYRGARQKRAAH